MQLINEYRVSVGLNNLDIIPYISLKCEEHNNNMISMNIVSHNVARFEYYYKSVGLYKCW
jgi:phosphopantetheine adenylyltransferase